MRIIVICVWFIPFVSDVYFHFQDRLGRFLTFTKDTTETNMKKKKTYYHSE